MNLIFAIWIKYMPAGLGTAPLTTPVASTAILVLGLAYLLAANARWAPFLGSVDAKLAAALGKVRRPGPLLGVKGLGVGLPSGYRGSVPFALPAAAAAAAEQLLRRAHWSPAATTMVWLNRL